VGPDEPAKETKANHLARWLPAGSTGTSCSRSFRMPSRHHIVHRSERPLSTPNTRRRRARYVRDDTNNGHEIHSQPGGFLTDPDRVDEELVRGLATQIGITMTDRRHGNAPIRYSLRKDFQETGETPTLRRVSTVAESRSKTLFVLFPRSQQEDGLRPPACPSRSAASNPPPATKEALHDHHRRLPGDRPPTSTLRPGPAENWPSSAPRGASTWPTRGVILAKTPGARRGRRGPICFHSSGAST